MSSPQPKSADDAGPAKYNVRNVIYLRLGLSEEAVIQDESSCGVLDGNHSEDVENAKVNDGAVAANGNESFASSDESGPFERYDLPLRNPHLGLDSMKSSPSTPYKGFKGSKINTDIASGRSRFSSSASPSPTKELMLRRGATQSASPSVNALKMKSWRAPTPKSSESWRKESPTPQVDTPGAISERGVPLGTPEVASARRVPPGVEVTEGNAQKYYSTKECLFLANLDVSATDHELQAELEGIFKKHGTCYVKVQRDKKGMPQAFVQFTCRSDAERALEEHKILAMHGRLVRIEWSKANREYYIAAKDGSLISEEIARDVLARYGAIEKLLKVDRLGSVTDFAETGMFVVFENYQSGRDAVKLLQDSEEWIVVEHDRHGIRKKAASPDAGMRALATMENYRIDRNSAFIGNLRPDVTEKDIRELCEEYGKVVGVDIQRRLSSRTNCAENVFAFVQFTNPEEVKAVVNELHGAYARISCSRLKADFKKSPEVLYPETPMANRNATRIALFSPSRSHHLSSPAMKSPMGSFGMPMSATRQNAFPGSPLARAYQQNPPNVYAPQATAPAYYQGPQVLASPGQQGPSYSAMAPANGLQTSTEGGTQSKATYGPAGNWAPTSEGYRWANPPNAPYHFPGQAYGQTYAGGPPPNAGYSHNGHGHPDPQLFACAPPPVLFPQQYYPQPQVLAGVPCGPEQVGPMPPSSLYPSMHLPVLSPNAHFNVAAGAAATQHGGVNPSDLAYGRSQDLSPSQAQIQADAVVDKYLGEGAMISPKKVDAPNHPCSVSDIIAGPADDVADIKAENSDDTKLTTSTVENDGINVKKECKTAKKVKAGKRGSGKKQAKDSGSQESKAAPA